MVDDFMNDSRDKKNKIEQIDGFVIEEKDNKQKSREFNSNKKSSKKNKEIFTTKEVIFLVLISLIVGFFSGTIVSKNKTIIYGNQINDKNLKEFVENYQYILNNYYKEIDKEDLINSAISGMMESLDDPYSLYIDEDESNNFSITLDGSYKGLGIQIIKDNNTGYMLITSVFKDSSAEEAGVLVGDEIVSINGKEAKEITASEFSDMVFNSKENIFNIKLLRDDEYIDVVLNKKTIELDSVSYELIKKEDKKIGYIYIGIFANNTYEQFKKGLEKLETENIDSLIIDVRGNTGGHLLSVDQILDLFLGSKHIKYKFDKDGKITTIYGKGNENKNYNIVLLGDKVSASASEVLIAGLKENLDSIFIGKKTYGKGTVQEMITLSDGSQYKITVKKWLTPKGNWINDTEGILPDIEIDLDDKYFETYENDDDSQLQAAIDYIIDNE